MLICPAQTHMHFDVLFRIGMLPSSTVGDPVIQGAGVLGMQGMGVSTPSAAVVAAATVGLDGDMHMPKGMMLAIGLLSMMLAATCVPQVVLFTGGTTSAEGATPMVHINWAVMTVTCAIALSKVAARH